MRTSLGEDSLARVRSREIGSARRRQPSLRRSGPDGAPFPFHAARSLNEQRSTDFCASVGAISVGTHRSHAHHLTCHSRTVGIESRRLSRNRSHCLASTTHPELNPSGCSSAIANRMSSLGAVVSRSQSKESRRMRFGDPPTASASSVVGGDVLRPWSRRTLAMSVGTSRRPIRRLVSISAMLMTEKQTRSASVMARLVSHPMRSGAAGCQKAMGALCRLAAGHPGRDPTSQRRRRQRTTNASSMSTRQAGAPNTRSGRRIGVNSATSTLSRAATIRWEGSSSLDRCLRYASWTFTCATT